MNKPLPQLVSHSRQNNMEEIINRATIGWLGTIASFSLQNIDALASIAVALATLIYMIVSIYKTLKELRK